MNARRIRTLVGSAFILSFLGFPVAAPVGAAGCTLTAPATVEVGDTLAVEGTGFPPNAIVAFTVTATGEPPNQSNVQADGSGRLQVYLEADTVGLVTVAAAAGSSCSAQVTFTTTGAAPTATPTPTPTASPRPTASPTPTATGAVAGAQATQSTSAPRPTTSVQAAPRDRTAKSVPQSDGATVSGAAQVSGLWLLAVLLTAIGAVGLYATRRAGRR